MEEGEREGVQGGAEEAASEWRRQGEPLGRRVEGISEGWKLWEEEEEGRGERNTVVRNKKEKERKENLSMPLSLEKSRAQLFLRSQLVI